MDTAALEGSASARSAFYWLLANLLLNVPDEPLVLNLRQLLTRNQGEASADPLSGELAALCAALPGPGPGTTELSVEYTRLLGGVRPGYGPPPPYESVHVSSNAAIETAHAVSCFYYAAGLVPTDQSAPPDHLGVELRFMALLCHSESDARNRRDDPEAGRLLRQQRDFLDQHLLKWAPRHLDTLQAEARHPFFRSLAALTRKMVIEDRGRIEELLVDARVC